MKSYGVRRRGESPDANAGRLIAELESEFDLLRLERYMVDLEQRDARLAEEIDLLKACIRSATSPKTSRLRRWGRVPVIGGKVF